VTFHYKGEYAERSRLAKRSERLNIYMHKLHHLAITKKIAVVITNHATNEPDEDFRYNIGKPYGGNVLSHGSRYIINLVGKPSGSVMATLTKSPINGPQSLQIFIENFGFIDAGNRYLTEEND
jgi:RecA/RadA recombinase